MIVAYYWVRLPLLDIAISGFVRAAKDDAKAAVIRAQEEAAVAAKKAQELYAEWAANNRKETK